MCPGSVAFDDCGPGGGGELGKLLGRGSSEASIVRAFQIRHKIESVTADHGMDAVAQSRIGILTMRPYVGILPRLQYIDTELAKILDVLFYGMDLGLICTVASQIHRVRSH